ncbi:MAG: hypothetical protein JOZ62_10315 [Acidobacteriaceae bacterium]|nr:hypothetical protein [Acidobacteriaceae bacterium]
MERRIGLDVVSREENCGSGRLRISKGVAMFRLVIVICAAAVLALAEAFTFSIGSPVAAQDFRAKMASFVFRTEGCADAAKLDVSGSAEGLVKGSRQSLPLKLARMSSRPGVFAVYRNWSPEGDWVVSLKGTCAGASAGLVVAVGPKGFIRESAKFFPRPATDGEIENALKARAQEDRAPGGSK